MKMHVFYSHASKTHVQCNKDFALSLVFNVRVFRTRKWPIHIVVKRPWRLVWENFEEKLPLFARWPRQAIYLIK